MTIDYLTFIERVKEDVDGLLALVLDPVISAVPIPSLDGESPHSHRRSHWDVDFDIDAVGAGLPLKHHFPLGVGCCGVGHVAGGVAVGVARGLPAFRELGHCFGALGDTGVVACAN